MHQILEKISMLGIIPVVKLDNIADASPLANALCEGGLPCIEITFRTDAAEEAIKIMATEFPEMLVGAGTVLTIEQADKAIAAGAKFIVSPGLNPTVVKHCMEKGIPITPGCSNPSDIEQALELGLDAVKFFPAEAAGGLAMIKAMSAPYINMKFMPTGGIHAGNLTEYLAFPKVIACGGSWMVKDDLIRAGDFKKITDLTREAITSMLGFELKHVGINTPDKTEADNTASSFEKLFGFTKTEGPRGESYFAGTGIEVMKSKGRGSHGHIAISTNSVPRAVYHLNRMNFDFDMESALYDENNNLIFIYLKDLISGFAVHLTKK